MYITKKNLTALGSTKLCTYSSDSDTRYHCHIAGEGCRTVDTCPILISLAQ